MNTLAIDLGGSRIKIGYVTDGTVKKFGMADIPYGTTLNEALGIVKIKVKELLTCEDISSVNAVGFAYPGLVNFAEKRVVSASGKYTDAADFDFERWTENNYGCSCVIENDANAALLGEVSYGCAAGETDAVMLILGTGVGTAAVMDGRLVRGKHFQAGCLGGHFPVELHGRACTCGGHGCAEANSGTWALAGLISEHAQYENSPIKNESEYNFRVLGRYLDMGDTVALDVFEHCVQAWASCVVSLIHAYDPETVILSGGVLNLGERLTAPLIDHVHKNAWTPWGKVRFKTVGAPEQSVLLGLASLAETER